MTGFLDAAIAVHPRAWRDRYGAEVRATLLDVADERDGRVPVSETLPLVLRGLWMRARSSVTFWAGVAVVGILVASALVADVAYADGSLIDLVLRLNGGVGYALPVVALAAGWAAARARAERLDGVRGRVRRVVGDSLPLLAFTAIGYSAALVVLIARSDMLWFAPLGLLALIGHGAMVLAAVAAGQLLGAVLPRVLVIVAAPAAIGAVTLLLFAWQTPWNAAPSGLYAGLAYVTDTAPFVRVLAVAGVIVACAVAAVSVRAPWLRAVPIFALIGIGAVVAVQPQPDASPSALRPESQLVCSSAEPVICLWPEQEAAFGEQLRTEMDAAYSSAVALGLPVGGPAARSVTQYGMTAIPAPPNADWEDVAMMGYGTSGIGPDDFLAFYAFSMPACCWQQPTGDGEYMAVAYSVSMLLGVPADEAWPALEDPYTGQRLFDPSGIPDEAAARALVERWLADGVNGVHAP